MVDDEKDSNFVTEKWGLPYIESKTDVKTRAEDYTIYQYMDLNCYHSKLKENVESFLFQKGCASDGNNIRLLVGDKGTGKTFTILKVIYEAIGRLKLDIKPLVYNFYSNNKIKRLIGNDLSNDEREAIDEADIIIFDDIHYIAEWIERNECDPEYFIDLLYDIVTTALNNSDKRLIVVSNKYLSGFVDIFQSKKYNSIIRMFGQNAHDEINRDIKYFNLLHFDHNFSYDFYKNMVKEHDMNIPEMLIHLMDMKNVGARSIVRFKNKFGRKITREDLVDVIVDRIDKMNLGNHSKYYKFWVSGMPYVSFNLSNFVDDIWNYDSQMELQKFINFCEEATNHIGEMIKTNDKTIDDKKYQKNIELIKELKNGSVIDKMVYKKYSERYFEERNTEYKLDGFNRYIDNQKDYLRFNKFYKKLIDYTGISSDEILSDYENMVTNVGGTMIPLEIFEITLSKELYGVQIPNDFASQEIKYLRKYYQSESDFVCNYECNYYPSECSWKNTTLVKFFNYCPKINNLDIDRVDFQKIIDEWEDGLEKEIKCPLCGNPMMIECEEVGDKKMISLNCDYCHINNVKKRIDEEIEEW